MMQGKACSTVLGQIWRIIPSVDNCPDPIIKTAPSQLPGLSMPARLNTEGVQITIHEQD